MFACFVVQFNTLRDISVCNLTYIPKLGITFATRFDIRYYVWYNVVYIGVASAVKVEMKVRTVFLGVPICIWVDMASKSKKIVENCTFFFVDRVKCYVGVAK